VDETLMKKVEERIVKPTIEGLQKRAYNYTGFVFIGLIKVGDEPYVIEYNCRMGDPETQVVLPRIKNDFLEILKSTLDGHLSSVEIEKDERSASAVILVSGGYPEAYEKGKEITGLEKISNGLMIHAGTKKVDNKILSNGGRVLASLSFGDHFQDALKHAYANAAIIEYEGKHYRKDIGFDL
jgi:phosphoribosylamine--glycine ligase